MALPQPRALSRPTGSLTAAARPHRLVAELDGRGEIDRHATMCLQHGIEGAIAGGARAIVVDLRDLTSIAAPALQIFVRARAACQAVPLGLLISGRESHAPIAHAFASAGLGDLLQVTAEPPARKPAASPVTPLRPARRARAARPHVTGEEWTRDGCT